MVAHISSAPGGCPDLQTLRRFQQGTVDAQTLTTLANHIAECDLCVSVLDSLQRDTEQDDLVAAIRQCFDQTPEAEERQYAPLAAAAIRFVADPPTLPEVRTEASGSSVATIPRPRLVGPYEVLETIGGGGMGVVYRARQTLIDRTVALKMIVGGMQAAPQMVKRFHTEGKAVARLRHPNVVEIYDFNEWEGQPYLAMELLEGGSLAHRLREGPLPVRAAAELVRALAQGVEAAHQAGVLHRDLKPSNVLLGSTGVPKITDFGLAKLLDSDDIVVTQTEAVLGTPAYMAPEQAAGKTKQISARTDVYALGVILYEALTGKPLFRGEDKAKTLKMVRTTEPVPPSKLRREVPRNLEAICLKCLEKSPARRYASAQALGEDLDLWLRNEKPRGTPKILERTLRGIRRHVAVIGLGLVVCSVAMAVPLLQPNRRLSEIESELEADGRVTLIGDSGPPRWFRWLQGEARGKTEVQRGKFTVHTQDVALLELLPDPLSNQYLYSMRVRHTNSTLAGQVGLFVCRESHPGGPTETSFYTALTFNDLLGPADHPLHQLRPAAKRIPEKTGRPRLFPKLSSDDGPTTWGLGCSMIGQSGPAFKLPGRDVGWRQLKVMVSPAGVVAYWDGVPFTLPAAQIAKGVSIAMKDLREHPAVSEFGKSLQPEFTPQGGLGLFVSESSAAFCDVTVERLPGVK